MEKYTEPAMDIVDMEKSDVITGSGCTPECDMNCTGGDGCGEFAPPGPGPI